MSKVVAAIFCLKPVEKLGENSWILNIFPYFLLASSGFLIATFVVYALVPEMRNLHGLSVMCQVASLAVTYICLAINQMSTNIHGIYCIVIGTVKQEAQSNFRNHLHFVYAATVLHFFFLSAFSWINVISFYTWWIFR